METTPKPTTPAPLTPQAPDPARPNLIVPTAISLDYAALGVTCGYDPVPLDQLRLFILGPAGGGKTTFAAGSPRSLILDFEQGASGIPSSRAHRLNVLNYEKLHAVKTKLLDDAKKPNRPYDRIIIDSMCEMAEIVNQQLVDEINARSKGIPIEDITSYGTKGAGYSLLRKRTWSIIKELEAVGYTWTIVDHITEKTISSKESGEITVLRPVLFDTFGKTISRAADITCSIFPRQKATPILRTVQGRQVQAGTTIETVYTLDCSTDFTSNETVPGKVRYVPDMMTKIELPHATSGQLGWDFFGDRYEKAVAEMKTKLGING